MHLPCEILRFLMPPAAKHLQSKHLRAYILAALGSLSCAYGGTLLGQGTTETVSGIALIAGGIMNTLIATVLASVHGPDPLLWQPIAKPNTHTATSERN